MLPNKPNAHRFTQRRNRQNFLPTHRGTKMAWRRLVKEFPATMDTSGISRITPGRRQLLGRNQHIPGIFFTQQSQGSTAQGGGGSFNIGNLQQRLVVANHGWQSEATDGSIYLSIYLYLSIYHSQFVTQLVCQLSQLNQLSSKSQLNQSRQLRQLSQLS